MHALKIFVNMPLNQKLLISFGLVTAFLCAVVWTALATMFDVNKLHHAIYEKDVPIALDLMALSENMRRMRVAGQLMTLVDDTTVQDKQVQVINDIGNEDKAIIARLKERFHDDRKLLPLIEEIDKSLNSFYEIRGEHINPRALADKTDEEKAQILKIERNRFQEMWALSEMLRDLPQRLAADHLRLSDERAKKSTDSFFCLGLAAITCSLLLVAMLTRLVVEPVRAITLAAKKIEAGDLLAQLKNDDRLDELGVLSRAFSKMREALLQRSKELETAMNEVRESNAQLQHFAYIAAHDLKEPLRTITSYLDLLAKRQLGKLDEKSEKYIRNSMSGADRMGELIDALLSYARLDTRAAPMIRTECTEVIDQVRQDLQVLLKEKGASFTHDLLPVVTADRRQLSQLFQNLVQNALKFHGENPPTVHVSSIRQDSNWLFSVKDNGIGMEMEFAERIFAIFQRLHTKEEYPGTGMGLSICKKIVERHGGTIWVESTPGKGATFFFTIPLEVSDPSSPTASSTSKSHQSTESSLCANTH